MIASNFAVNEKIDLTNCDREPIHIPGTIQPHSAILVMEEPSMHVVQTSANSKEIIGFAPEELLGESWEKVLPAETVKYLKREILPKNLEGTPFYLPPIRTASGKNVEAIIHRYQGVLILELEENKSFENIDSIGLYASLKTTLVQLEATKSVGEFCKKAAEAVREFTGFDRVMIYRFSEDDSGEVIAESKREDLESYLGLHYPASDIPSQARRLYVLNQIRLKSDIDCARVPLVTIESGSEKPLDMTYTSIRSMSPIHLEYLRNMGIRASMSLSIIKDGRLWGMIPCHHYTPRYVPHAARMATELLAHFLSLQMANKNASEDHEYAARLNHGHAELVEVIAQNPNFVESLYENKSKLLNWIEADGAALSISEEIHLVGKTPQPENVRAIFDWLGENTTDEVYSTNNLPAIFPHITDCREFAAGVLAIRLSRHLPHFIMWFRPEISQSVNWAGDPKKLVETGEFGDRLTPRKSFELWTEEVVGKSAAWKTSEIEAAANLRRSILEIVVRKAEALAKLNAELTRSNVELDSFAYIASHDLKEPLRGIHNFSKILIEQYSQNLPLDGQEKLQTLVRLTQRMESLIESLLHYSHIGRAELSVAEVDLNRLLRDSLEMIEPRLSESKVEIRIAKNLPKVRGDEVLLREVFTNLLTNAVKYNNKENPLVEVGYIESETPEFFVRDNGIGIPEKHFEQIFRIFKRLHGRDSFGGGIGAGLTITKKIIERHDGKIRLKSAPNEGTTFYFTLGAAK